MPYILRFVFWAEPCLSLAGILLLPPPRKAFCIPTAFFLSPESFPALCLPCVLEHSGTTELGPPYLLLISSSARNVRPKMTIYVCQELEQNQVPLQQKRDGSGDSSLCGELRGALSTRASYRAAEERKKQPRSSHRGRFPCSASL